MTAELFINQRLVDLDQSIPFPLTFNINDIKDLSSRKGNKSKTITLPGTRRNYELMLSVFTLTNIDNISDDESNFIDFDPSVKAPCQYYNNGLLEFNGIAQLMECKLNDGIWSFEITLVSDQIDYISRLQKIKVNELDFSEYDHTLELANIEGTWIGDMVVNGVPVNLDGEGLGYYYGLIDYGYTRPGATQWNIDQIPPQVFVYDILKKAFAYAGIKWSSNFFETTFFKQFLLAYQGGEMPTITDAQAENDSAYTTEQNNAGSGAIIFGTTQASGSGIWFLPDQTLFDDYDASVNQDNLNQITTTAPMLFTCSTEGLFTINYVGDHVLQWTTGGTLMYGNYSVKLLVFKNNIAISADVIYSGQLTGATTGSTVSYSFDYKRDINLLINDELKFQVVYQLISPQIIGGTDGVQGITTEIVSDVADLNILKAQQALTAGGTVSVSAFLPDMTCDVFFKGIITAFNLLVKPNTFSPSYLEIEPLNDFYNPSGDALDWTYKIDKSKELTVTPTINFSSKNYNFLFDQDDDFFNNQYTEQAKKQYGQFIVQSQNQYAVDDTDLKLPFAQKVLANIPDGIGGYTNMIVPRTFRISTDEEGVNSFDLKKGKPFIVMKYDKGLLKYRGDEGQEFGIRGAERGNYGFFYPYVGHLDNPFDPGFDFNWGVPDLVYWDIGTYTANNLFKYHDTFLKEILSRYGKQLSCYAMLKSNDINSLDFRNLINIDGVVYRLIKISDYDSNKNTSTQIELIRILQGEGIQTTQVTSP